MRDSFALAADKIQVQPLRKAHQPYELCFMSESDPSLRKILRKIHPAHVLYSVLCLKSF